MCLHKSGDCSRVERRDEGQLTALRAPAPYIKSPDVGTCLDAHPSLN